MSTGSCPKCQTANPAGARFCGACGASLSAAPPPPPPPPPGGGYGGYGGGSRFGMGMGASAGGLPDAHTVAPMAQQATFDHIAQVVAQSGGHVLHAAPPQALQVSLPFKNFYDTGGMTVRYNGAVTLAAKSAGETEVQAKFSVDWNSTFPLFATVAVCFIFMWFSTSMNMMTRNWGGLWLLFGILAMPYMAWQLANSTPKKLGVRFLQMLSGAPVGQPAQRPAGNGGGGDFMGKLRERSEAMRAAMGGLAPQQQQAPPQQPPPAANTAPIEQLERLAKLRDAGAITAAEFEAKKAELLARL